MEPKQKMEYFCRYTETNFTVEECLMKCALETVKNKVGHLDMIMKSKKYPQFISTLIRDIWKDLKDEAKDLEYLITNPHSLELLRVLGTLQREKPSYRDELTAQAKMLLTNIQNLLSKLHQNLYELPSKLTLDLLKNEHLTDILQLHLEDKTVLRPLLEKLRNDVEKFEHIQEQSKALLQLLELTQETSAVITQQIRENISHIIFLSNESRSLNQLDQLWKGIDIMMYENIKTASKSRFFKKHWKSASEKDRQSHNVVAMSLCDLHERVFKPALADFIKSCEEIKDLSMHVDEFETVLADCHENQIEEELRVMQEYLSDKTESKWIKDVCDCIKRYRELCSVVKQAQGIYSLKEELSLKGDFHVLCDIQQKDVLKTKCLKDFTEEMGLIGQTLRDIDDRVLCLIEEFKDCARKNFIKWIKSILKDQRELNVFVELASAFAGENPMDLDKVRYFRDAVFACTPLIFELEEGADFDNLMDKIQKLKEPVQNDCDLQQKLKDSCTHKEWLETAYTAHGSVAKSSFLQADEINKCGVYYIRQPSSQSLMKMEDCIYLEIKEKTFRLSQLQDLQNKLMLISATDRKGRNKTVSQFVEVLEQVLHAGQLLIKLREAGHILFANWSLTGFCEGSRRVSVHVDFGIAGLMISGNQSLLVELKGICKSMQDCLEKWVNYTTQHRDEYYYLNYFTAKQLSRLCCCMADMQKSEQVSSSILNMLSFIKDNVTTTDLLNAFKAALQSPVQNRDSLDLQSPQVKDYLVHFPELIEYAVDAGYSEASAKAAVMFCKSSGAGSENSDVDEDAVMDCVYENSNDDAWVEEWSVKYDEERESVLQSQMKFTGGHVPEQMKPAFAMSAEEMKKMFENLTSCQEKMIILWETYCGKLSGLVSDKYVGLDLLGETLNQLAKNEVPVQRKLPRFLERGKPNLVSCNATEMLPQCLSLYLNKEQPLPTYDEILICTPETTAEEVELVIRRAVQPGSTHEKIYSLLNAENLKPEVTRVLESNFCRLSQSQNVTEAKEYNFVIFCNAKAHHSYVLTAFDEYRKTLLAKDYKEIHQLLKMKHKLSIQAAFPATIIQEEFRQSIKMITSARAGMGKTLFVKNLITRSKEKLTSQGFTHKTISITDSEIKPGFIYDKLKEYEDKPNDNIPRIFHFDVPPVVCKGLYTFLVQLFVLRCFQSLDGFIWKCKDTHIYLVEYTERKLRQCDRENSEISTDLEDSLLQMFTTVRCFSPEETLKHLQVDLNNSDKPCEFQLMDDSKFTSEEFQRTYQYLKHFQENNLEELTFDRQKSIDSPEEWLECIFRYCKIRNPSWAELCNYTHFLNMQLKRCEESVFCSNILRNDLTGFRHFVVKFMITMSRDFTMPSLVTSDESCERKNDIEREEEANDVLSEFQMRKHWEQEAHPYIMFNSDNVSMTFLGFHIKYRNAIDVRTGKIIERDVITSLLFRQLIEQRVPMNVDFKTLNRCEQLEILCRVLGVEQKDPDSTYELTLDNVLKILAIHLRFQCNIPVVIMGETGCGKTRLVKFMCDLLKRDDDKTNLMVVRVHGGTTSHMIYQKVKQAIDISKINSDLGMYTVLFFDEANTTEALYAIKEVMCDRAVNGGQIDAPDLKFVAACNPYKKHTKSAIKQLEKAGLGYSVRAEDASEKFGRIPMRQLVYRVQPLPPSLSALVWDFGKLNEGAQNLYITKMVETFFKTQNLNEQHQLLFTDVISTSQTYMAAESNECRMVSLRDIERCLKTVMWFYHQKETLFPLVDQKKMTNGSIQRRSIDDLIRSLILAIGVCYSASLEQRMKYIEKVAKALSLSAVEICDEIDFCQEVFVDNVDIPPATARNDALKENVFMMIVCMNLRLPLFLVGKPGSSKSLSKTVAADALQGKSSRSELFKSYKQAQLLSFQCSAHSTSEGIISTFKQCAQLQLNKNLDEYVSVVVLDEIGLAEDSPKMPLKTLHPLLECGCIDDEEPEEFKKVGFIGLSNWSLDPAKMNRGILLLRASPAEKELEKTAKEICSVAETFNTKIEENIHKLTQVYSEVLHKQNQGSEFYGLRDYYNLFKVIATYAQRSEPSTDDLARAVQRNFGVLDSVNSLEIFSKEFKVKVKPARTIDLVRENLETEKSTGLESRYLLLLSSNNAALSILLRLGIIADDSTEVIFGSGFPLDQEYSQVCRTVNRVKTCMETGRSVVLLNIQSLYESLYDALNQCYVKLGGSVYVDLGLGAHRVKCKVNEGFRLIVIEEKNVVYAQFPAPLLSRLEKHCLEFNTILPEHAEQLRTELEKQTEEIFSGNTQEKCDALIGFTQDSCASVLLQCCPEILLEDWDANRNDDVLNQCREKLVQCATLDSVIRVRRNTEIQNIYFNQQTHTNLMDVIKKYRSNNDKRMCLEVSTYSLLLNQRNLKFINEELNISKEQSHLLQIREFLTEQAFCEAVR
ncbi:E3 ubiquitin-protein ligase rnf213-alpha-like [Colossoma macropomum]|uniref:E3 ubiquitin-protein ligase rnf213-alpha-like n=1 Tax=Colossoma macropomum TaxID=42526 RepID=UPI00186536DE|nr:E3 ubiquitin-protein ligase rnf213-alpha-like [Colossoma macropomum]